MTYTERSRRIAIVRQVEAGAIDCRDTIVLAAAQRVIRALGWMRKADAADWALVQDFAAE